MNRLSIPLLMLAMAALVSPAASQQTKAPATPAVGEGETAPAIAGLDDIAQKREELRIAEKEHPGNTAEVADALMALVQRQRIDRKTGPETLELAQRAVTVAEGAKGKESILYAYSLACLAKAYLSADHPEKGRPLAEQALEIAKRTGQGTRGFAEIADALGKVCFGLGDYPCALYAEELAVASVRLSHEKNELYLASMLQDLARVRLASHDLPGTRAAMEESVAIVERQTTPARSLPILENNAGSFFVHNGDQDKGFKYLTRSIELSSAMYGTDSIQVAYAAGNLGDLFARTGRFNEAWPQLERSYSLYKKFCGPDHTQTAAVEANYAADLAAAGRLKEATGMALHARKLEREYVSLAIRVMPERQALALEKINDMQPLDVLFSIAARHPDMNTAAVYQEEIRSRALVAEEMAQRQASLNRTNDPEVAALLKDLDKERSAQLADRNATPTNAPHLAYTDATARMERIERALAERSIAFRTNERTRVVALDDVRQHLPPQSVLVSYVSFFRLPVEADKTMNDGTPAYMAFVLHPNSDRIRVFDLGDAKSINDLVTSVRDSADAEAHSSGLGSARNERAYRDASDSLRRKVWDPIRAELGNARLALVVADGSLNLIPFGGLSDGKGYLVEHGPVIHMLTSERDLVPSDDSGKKNGLLAIGSPAFDLASNSLAPSPLRDTPVTCEAFNKLEFHPLPGAEAEVTDIRTSWRRWNGNESSQLVTGADATRARFLDEASHNRVLHVATHAFLLDKSCGNGNPLLHSGLVFAGANQAHESSVLTAQQIASLDLSGVDWAVLSACNTGNGELHDGEGVMGLERAFRVAGAHSVIMTLWPVDDDVTRRFMHELYTERLGGHATTADAVWNSARKLLLERRAAGKSTHPWYWAGFVGSGGWE
jgi:CHAT domain-containing protein